MMNATLVENSNPASATNANGVDSFAVSSAQALSSIKRSEAAIVRLQRYVVRLKSAVTLDRGHCNRCNRDAAHSMMMTDSLCDVCAAELDADYREFEQDRADYLYLLNH